MKQIVIHIRKADEVEGREEQISSVEVVPDNYDAGKLKEYLDDRNNRKEYRSVLKDVDDETAEVISFLKYNRQRNINFYIDALLELSKEIDDLTRSVDSIDDYVRQAVRDLRKDFQLEDDD